MYVIRARLACLFQLSPWGMGNYQTVPCCSLFSPELYYRVNWGYLICNYSAAYCSSEGAGDSPEIGRVGQK